MIMLLSNGTGRVTPFMVAVWVSYMFDSSVHEFLAENQPVGVA